MNDLQPRCPRCGFLGRSSTHFCVVCGSRYQAPISGDLLALAAHRQTMQRALECRRCDIPVRQGGRFCPSCGAALAQNAEWSVATG